jgi:hypothetical protein
VVESVGDCRDKVLDDEFLKDLITWGL